MSTEVKVDEGLPLDLANLEVSRTDDTASNETMDNNNQINGNAGPAEDDVDVFYAAEDSNDSRAFSIFRSSAKQSTTTKVVDPPMFNILRSAHNSVDYAMDFPNRGKCLIINNRIFEPRLQLNERNGTEVDGKSLSQCFQDLGFETMLLADGTANEIQERLYQLSKEDHSNSDCLVVCILSHGERGSLWGYDARYNLDKVYGYFTGDNCKTLAGKPKLFYIQACQGDMFDRGTTLLSYYGDDVADSASYHKIPTWADILIAQSTVPGYYAWRNIDKGSWFIQALTSVFSEFADKLDVLSMLTLVNQHVAYEFESTAIDVRYKGHKQVPCVTSMLTRRLFFTTKG